MTRVFGHYVAPGLIALLAIETTLTFSCLYLLLLLRLFPHPDGIRMYFDPQVANASLGLAVLTTLASASAGLYRLDHALRTRRLLLHTTVAGLLIITPILLVVRLLIYLGGTPQPGGMWITKILVCWLACVCASRLAFNLAVRSGIMKRRICVVAPDGAPGGRMLLQALASQPWSFTAITCSPQDMADPRYLKGTWGLVVADEAWPLMASDMLAAGRQNQARVISQAEFMERHEQRINVARLDPHWLSRCRAFPGSRVSAYIRRTTDILFGLILLVMTAPVSVLIMLAIAFDSPGPIFYTQERVGLNGRCFRIRKFRSMRTDAEAAGTPVWATTSDPRVTRVGRFLRLSRLDEIPQMLNIIAGDMSLIGPRPERPEFVAQLLEAIPRYQDRARVKPGLTGWAQVNLPYGSSIEDARSKLAYDLYYIKNRSLFLDALILIATVRVILFQEGAR